MFFSFIPWVEGKSPTKAVLQKLHVMLVRWIVPGGKDLYLRIGVKTLTDIVCGRGAYCL